MKKTTLDSIDVEQPCDNSWEQMSGSDKVRFCSHCEKDVYNLSAVNRVEAEKLVKTTKGKICVRYAKNSRGKVIFVPPKYTQIASRTGAAAGALATALSLSILTYAGNTAESSNSYAPANGEVNKYEPTESAAGMQNSSPKQIEKTVKKRKKIKRKVTANKRKSPSGKNKVMIGLLQ